MNPTIADVTESFPSRGRPLCLFLAACPALAQKVYIDFDGATAFSEYKTFAFKETGKDLRRVSSSLHQRVVQQLTDYATDGGLMPDEASPDVYFAYYAAFLGDMQLVLGDLEYTYGPGFNLGSYWQGGVGTRNVREKSFRFKEGTVVVDVWDPRRRPHGGDRQTDGVILAPPRAEGPRPQHGNPCDWVEPRPHGSGPTQRRRSARDDSLCLEAWYIFDSRCLTRSGRIR